MPSPSILSAVIGAKHTPGPWRTQGWVPTWAYIPIHDARHNLVASMYPDSGHRYTREEVEANARLIAAAPELLEALKLVVTRCGPNAPDGKQARAAIDKAEGRT